MNPTVALLIAGLIAVMSGVGAYRLWRAQHRYLSADEVRRRLGIDDSDEAGA